MAHESTVNVTDLKNNQWLVEIEETGAGASSEVQIPTAARGTAGAGGEAAIPEKGRLLRVTTAIGAGGGSTVRLVMGHATNPTGVDIEVEAADDEACNDLAPVAPIRYYAPDGLFLRPRPDSATDNTITTRLLVAGGWGV